MKIQCSYLFDNSLKYKLGDNYKFKTKLKFSG